MAVIGFYDIVGLFGVVTLVSAYAMLQWRRDFSKTFLYSALNLASATLLGISVFHHWNLASFVCNCFWGAISLYGLYRWSKYQRRARVLAQAPFKTEIAE